MKRILIAGAAGGLRRVCRDGLKEIGAILRLADIAVLGTAGPDEELPPCDLGNAGAVAEAVRGCDGIVHMGGVSVEQPFDVILNANIRGGVQPLRGGARARAPPDIPRKLGACGRLSPPGHQA